MSNCSLEIVHRQHIAVLLSVDEINRQNCEELPTDNLRFVRV